MQGSFRPSIFMSSSFIALILTVLWINPIEDVGFTATVKTIGIPVDIPPIIPPESFLDVLISERKNTERIELPRFSRVGSNEVRQDNIHKCPHLTDLFP